MLSLDILNHTNSIIDSSDPFIQELPYDNAAVHVKRIDAFSNWWPRAGSSSFRPIQTHAPLPEVFASATTGGWTEEPASPFQNRVEFVQEGTATIPEQFASGPDPGNADREIGMLRPV